ncbi:MAG: acyl-CoA desaturase, partial [Spongiibacter sp.]
YDPTKWLIKTASWIGLTWDLKKVPDFKIQRAVLTMKFKRAEQRLLEYKGANALHLSEFLEKEYLQFRKTLQDWNAVGQEWMDAKRQSIAEQTECLQQNLADAWEHATLRSRFQELEYAMKMQIQRLETLRTQLA